MQESRPMRIEVWSDVQCVWCYVGDARWKKALAEFPGEVDVVHRSFELQPGFPVDFDAREYLEANRGMDAAEQERVFAAMKKTASAEGLGYEPERIRPTNSHLALELLHYAETVGARASLSDRLYAAYFAEGRHIGTVESLLDLAADVGIDVASARRALESREFAEAVDRDAATAHELGARGVPFVVIDGAYAIPGAVEVDQLKSILAQVANA